MFENKVIRKLFGAKRDEVTGEYGKLHNAELQALYSSPDIIRNIKCKRLRWAGHVAGSLYTTVYGYRRKGAGSRVTCRASAGKMLPTTAEVDLDYEIYLILDVGKCRLPLSEQKRFLQQHKQRSETYSKAAATMKKQRKKNKGTTKTGLAMDKELKNMQVLEEEKSKLDAFCEQSLKTAMTQERRRYGFVLERQCSLAKHYLAYHNQGSTVLQRHLDDWQEVAQTREFLPDSVEVMFTNRLRQVSFWPDEDLYSSPRSPNVEDDRLSIASQLRKTKSMDASCLDMRSINDATSPMKPLSRAKSDFNLTASTHSLVQGAYPDTPTRPKSMAVPDRGPGWDTQLARALYAYLSSGDNQLSFLEGDIIALMGERNKGWQFGENLRTQCSGWFPLAYTELILDDARTPSIERIPNLTGEQSDGITVFRIPPMTSLMLHRCRTGAINLQRWWQSPSAAISESDWFLYRAEISRRTTSCTVVSWRCVLL
ncbi:hypothetical protein ANN_12859 [Periplaneta americana]|uniref:Brain-specific angiogenesis inhibitor 1-associated protein 2 n=1 Tax=Periplaneta americana TaxID=6978 RepID=A0ABQ8TJ49_PERAM|nr:hypothetical protein ANN_12859 [Periplaneta americana]